MFKKGDTGKTRGGYDYRVMSTRRGMLQVTANGMDYSCWPDGQFSGSGGTDLDLTNPDFHDMSELADAVGVLRDKLRAMAESSERARQAYEHLRSAMEVLS